MFSWLIPGRTDLLVTVGCFVLLAGLLDPFFVQQWELWTRRSLDHRQFWLAYTMIAACLLGMVMTHVWGHLNARSAGVLLGACLASVGLFLYSISIVDQSTVGVGLFGDRQQPLPDHFANWFSIALFLGKFFAATFAVLLAVVLVAAGIRRVIKRFAPRSLKTIGLTRTRFLIGVAVFLFVVHMAFRSFTPDGVLVVLFYPFDLSSRAPAQAMGVFAVLGFLGFVLFPSWLFASSTRRRWKLAFVGLLILIAVVNLAIIFDGEWETQLIWIAAFPTYLIFLLSVTAVSKSKTQPMERTRIGKPKSWSLIPVGLVCVSLFAVARYDISTLFISLGRDWSGARLARQVAVNSNYKVKMIIYGGQAVVFGELGAESSPEMFSQLAACNVVQANLSGLSPSIDVAGLNSPSSLLLSNSSLTTQQLQSLVGSNAAYLQLYDVTIEAPDGSVDLGAPGRCDLAVGKDTQITSLLDSIGRCSSQLIQVRIVHRVPEPAELDAIVAFSQRVPVSINKEIFDAMVASENLGELSLKNICAPFGSFVNAIRDSKVFDQNSAEFRFMVERDISISFDQVDHESLFWNLAFLKQKSAWPNYASKITENHLSDVSNFIHVARRYHWSFGENENQELTDLFVPCAEDVFDRRTLPDCLLSLETLSFDPYWLSREVPNFYGSMAGPNRWDVKSLTFARWPQLKNLKRLDFDPRRVLESDQFLLAIPQIEHLQVQFDFNIDADFRNCRQLKTLVHFGGLSPRTIASLRMLKNLKQVIVVDIEDGMLDNPGKVNALEKSVPGVEVKVVPRNEFVPTPPEKFNDHVKERAAKIRAELEK